MQKFICNICGYPDLDEPPYDETGAPSFEICPCCGGEFGYHDATPEAKENYRKDWVQNGARWFTPDLKPAIWSLRDQLLNIGNNLDDI